jgi:hypothetical protein
MAEAARRVRRVQDEAEAGVLRFLRSARGEEALGEAWEDFAGEFGGLEPDGPESQLFLPWAIYDWSPAIAGRPAPAYQKPPARLYLDENRHKLSSEEVAFLQRTCATPLSFHDVVEVEPGRRLRVRDVLLETETEVFEQSGSETLRAGDVIFARVVPYDGVALLIGSGSVPLPPIEKGPILRVRKRLREEFGQLAPAMVHAAAPQLLTLYLALRENVLNPAPPVLHNTDGDPIEFHTITWDVESAATAFRALKSLAKGEPETDLLREAAFDEKGCLRKVEFAWLKAGNKLHRSWENTVLGHVSIEGTSLEVEVNSAARARRIQGLVRRRLGAWARNLTVRIKPVDEALRDYARVKNTPEERKRRKDEERFRSSPEAKEMMRRAFEQHWEGWIEEKIPALDGKTPFQAVRTPEGREMVEALLLQAERTGRGEAGDLYDFNRLRRKLGLKVRERSSRGAT